MKELNIKLQEQFNRMQATGKLFKSSLTGQQVWDLYLESFGQDPIFRDPASSEHACNLCNNFIRRYANIVAIDENNQIQTIFDVEITGEYENTVQVLSKKLKTAPIQDIFLETFDELNKLPYEKCTKQSTTFQLGMDKNVKRYTKEEAEKFGVVKPNELRTFDHMFLRLDKQFVDMSNKSQEALQGEFRDAKNVFERAMQTISLDTLNLVKDLIKQGSLLDGTAHLFKIEAMIPLKEEYDNLSANQKSNWCWVKSYKFNLAKFRNELIGVLCTELSEGEELNKACQSWNKRVDPVNFMKTVAPITKKQIEEAQKFVEDNGYTESFDRRLATLDDIKVSEILHSNVGKSEIKSVSIFDGVKSTSTRHKRNEFDGVEEVSIDKFMKDILPGCTSIEAFLTNKQEGNLVSLTTANNTGSKPIFKWSNNYSWTFNGNLAGKSQIKDAVKSRGGNTEGCLNIRLAFPNTTDDYDLHLAEPNGTHIYFSNRRSKQQSSGMLDLDAQGCDGHQPSEKRVENIIYTDIDKMPSGKYRIYVNNYSGRGFHTNFSLEIEIDGEITSVELEKTNSSNVVDVAYITLKNKQFTIELAPGIKLVNSNTISKEIYGLETNKFHKVNLVCLSPNHWGDNQVGNKHFLFMLDGCKSTSSLRSFHNENLLPELANHRKVLEVLGATNMIDSTNKQLSGLGFNSTVNDELIVKLSGSHKRTVKIKFG